MLIGLKHITALALLVMYMGNAVQAISKKFSTDEELFAAMGKSIGGLAQAYGTPEALAAEVNDEVTRPMALEGEDVVQMGCTDYLSADVIVKSFGEIVHTYYVSRAEDLLCFYYIAKSSTDPDSIETQTLETQLSVVSPIPKGAKVDSILNALVEAAPDAYAGLLSSLNYNNSAVLSIEYFALLGDRTVKTSSLERAEAIARYDLAMIESFANSAIARTGRASAWLSHVATLEAALETHANRDPCGFTDMFRGKDKSGQEPLTVDNVLRIPADSLITHREPDVGRACIALVAAVAAQDPNCAFVSLSNPPSPFNMRARSAMQGSTTGYTKKFNPYTKWGLRGDGEIVSVADTGLDEDHCFFRDDNGGRAKRADLDSSADPDYNLRKVIQYVSYNEVDASDVEQGHGTHVAGTVCGRSVGTTKADMYDVDAEGAAAEAGVAPNAQLAFVDLGKPGSGIYVPSTDSILRASYNAGSRAQCHSWGGLFGSTDRTDQYQYGDSWDEWLYDHRDMVVVFAAGNSGHLGRRSLTREATTKNAITVGAASSNSLEKVAFFSSVGPCYDGRIKPDVTAPGFWTTSARAGPYSADGKGEATCETVAKAGTSMAAPAVTGVAALIRQYFRDSKFWASQCRQEYPSCKAFTPSGVLIKTAILHAGTRMDRYQANNKELREDLGAPPDEWQGYGRVDLYNVMPLKERIRNSANLGEHPGPGDLFIHDLADINEYSRITYEVSVNSDTVPLKVTLAWYDPPAPGKPAKALIHDLDLMVISPDGDKRHGNGGDSEDDVNVNEQVMFKRPQVGLWKVLVSSHLLPSGGKEKYSLIVTCDGSTRNSGQEPLSDSFVPAEAMPVPIYPPSSANINGV